MSNVVLSHPFSYSCETGSLTKLELSGWARLMVSEPQVPSCLCIPRTRIAGLRFSAQLFTVGAGEPELGPHTCAASKLLTTPYPQFPECHSKASLLVVVN